MREREGGREGGKVRGSEGGREGGRKRGREINVHKHTVSTLMLPGLASCKSIACVA